MTLLRHSHYECNGRKVSTLDKFHSPHGSELEDTREAVQVAYPFFRNSEPPLYGVKTISPQKVRDEQGDLSSPEPLFIGGMDEQTARRIFYGKI